MKELKHKSFANGAVYALETDDGFPVEVTDTFLPYYTRDAVGRRQNTLSGDDLGSRAERWMIGVSVMSGCPVRCKFCAAGAMKRWRPLTTEEIVEQVCFVLDKNPDRHPCESAEFKVNYTRMGEPFLNVEAVREATAAIEQLVPGTHHYISTIGVSGSCFSWIKGNVTLQLSVHSLDETRRVGLIPWLGKLALRELGQVRTRSNLKTTLNLTLVDEADWDVEILRQLFDPDHFFVKLSPINPNAVSDANELGEGVISGVNMA